VKRLNSKFKNSTTVIKAFAILDLLASKHEGGISLSDVSDTLNNSKSTSHRYLTTLEELGVVVRDEVDHFYLGPKLIELTGIFLSKLDLRNEGEPFLERLSLQTQETTHLAIPSGTDVIYIAKVDSSHSIRMASHIGARSPMYCTSLGKAILAYYPVERVEEIAQRGLHSRTQFTISTIEALHAELIQVRTQGFAIDNQENEEGVRCVGAPIFDYSRKVIGAISVSGPANRITEDRFDLLGSLTADAATRISKSMGFQPN
jgi:IclR family acetate operon transcriptional repressor